MEQEPQEQEQPQQQVEKGIKIQTNFVNKLIIPLEVIYKQIYDHQQLPAGDTLIEIKNFLAENTILYFYNTFQFYKESEKLNEYIEIEQLGIEDNSEIQIKLDPYTEQTAKQHVKKIHTIFNNPLILKTIIDGAKQFNKNNIKLFDFIKEEPQKNEQKEENKQENPEDQNKEKQQENHKKNQDQEEKILQMSIQPDFENQYLQQFLLKENKVYEPCYQYITYCQYNPPSRSQQLKGDFFYLQVKSLENTIFYITSNAKGFFVNKSNNQQFDPTENQNFPVQVSLIDLLAKISNQFVIKFSNLLKELDLNKKESADFNQLEALNFKNYQFLKKSSAHMSDYHRAETYMQNPYGSNTNGSREWNNELCLFREMPQLDTQQKLNREKNIFKCYNDFVLACVGGAQAAVEGNLTPLNPNDQISSHVYVYNNIFFSFASPNTYNFKAELGQDQSPTFSVTNNDMRNFKILYKQNIPDLSLLHTVLVDYKGYRIICQSIIPGILNNDQQQCFQFGSIDEGNTIHNHFEFENLMQQICSIFYLESNLKFQDSNGKQITLSGSSEVKGVRGTDKRQYIIDLMRLSPRDLNYEDQEDTACVIRHELLTNYINQQCIMKASKIIENDEKLSQLEQDKNQQNYQKIDERIQKFNMLIDKEKQAFDLKLNSNIGTKSPIVLTEQQQENSKSRLQDIANFLKKDMVKSLIQEVNYEHENSKYIADSESFTKLMHRFGINVRYLGHLYKEFEKLNQKTHMYFVQRLILVRSLKHLLRTYMRDSHPCQIQNVISHIFNCVFSNAETINLLEKEEIKFSNQNLAQNAEQQKQNQKKKNKKNKNKNQTAENIQPSDPVEQLQIQISTENPILNLKPSEIWEQIRQIAILRYKHTELSEKIMDCKILDFNFQKLAMLRDTCLSTGIVLESKIYQNIRNDKVDIERDNGNLDYFKIVPFRSQDIIDIKPLIKALDFVSDEARNISELASNNAQMGQLPLKDTLDIIFQSIQITQQIFGQYHEEIGKNFQKLSHLYFSLNDLTNAIVYKKQALMVFKKIYGYLHYETAACFNSLGVYYFKSQQFNKSFKYFTKCLYIFSIIGGETLPDSYTVFRQMYPNLKELDLPQLNISIMLILLERSTKLYDKNDINIGKAYHPKLFFLQHLAIVHQDCQDIMNAIEYQQQCVNIMKQQKTPMDENTMSFMMSMDNYLQQLKKKLQDQKDDKINQQNALRENKQKKKQQQQVTKDIIKQRVQQQQNPEEISRQELLEKLRIAKMQASRGGAFRNFRNR